MCTAITYKTNHFYFGRTLDNSCSYNEQVVITPRNYPFHFKEIETITSHFAIIGMAHVEDNYPLYYDAINEKGLAMAGLNFVDNAFYQQKNKDKINITQYEFIQWILCQCTSVNEAIELIQKMNFLNAPFNDKLPIAKLHWMVADKNKAVVVESMRDGIKIYDNPIGVLTNNPPFDFQLFSLNNYMNLSAKPPKNNFSKKLDLNQYSLGMGAIGLPGDFSSQSRFIRSSFVKINSISECNEQESVNQFFHILNSVEQPKGCCDLGDENYEITLYSSCCNTDQGIYYYTTYENHQITAINMHNENLDGSQLICYSLIKKEQIKIQN